MTILVAAAMARPILEPRLPGWVNITLTVAALLASIERALRLRNHWLLDGGSFDGED